MLLPTQLIAMPSFAGTMFHTKRSVLCCAVLLSIRSLSNVARSVLLTSGTLSPLDSFSGELGLDFHVRLEAPHVVDVNRQASAPTRPTRCAWPGLQQDRQQGRHK